jgi:hypothetical protein
MITQLTIFLCVHIQQMAFHSAVAHQNRHVE